MCVNRVKESPARIFSDRAEMTVTAVAHGCSSDVLVNLAQTTPPGDGEEGLRGC